MLSYSDKLYALAVEKVKFNLAQIKLQGEAQLAMIDSRQFLIALTPSGHNDKEISKTLYEIFTFAF